MELNDICELIVDCEHKTAPTRETGYPSIRTPNIGRGFFILEGVNRVSEDTYRLWSRRAIPRAGDLIMAREAPVGNVAMIPPGLEPCLGQRTLLIRPDRAKVEPAFLNYFLNGPYIQSLIQAKTNGATVPHLNMKDVRTLALPQLPLRPIQRRIAGILSAYDELIENSQRRIKILEAMARALYREWFVHFRFPGHESTPRTPSPLGEIPQGWEVKKLGDLADISWGDTSTTKASYVAEGYAAYSAAGLDGKLDHYDFERIGIVLSAIGAQCGKTWFARGKWSCIKNTIRFWSKDERATTEFLFLATEGQNFWPRRGAAQPFISQGDAERIELLIPDRTTMNHFTDFVADALERKAILQEQIQNLRRTRNLLLPRLLSGQMTIPEQV
jgi:type I restriction enzyme S subunit